MKSQINVSTVHTFSPSGFSLTQISIFWDNYIHIHTVGATLHLIALDSPHPAITRGGKQATMYMYFFFRYFYFLILHTLHYFSAEAYPAMGIGGYRPYSNNGNFAITGKFINVGREDFSSPGSS